MTYIKSEKLVEEKAGVLDFRIDDHECVIKVRWRDGRVNERHFPKGGVPVAENYVDGNGNNAVKVLGTIEPEKAREILEENAPLLTEEEFSWRNFCDEMVKVVRPGEHKKKKAA